MTTEESKGVVFTAEELNAYRETKKVLLSKGMPIEKISKRELFLSVMNCKLRSETAAEKYTKWLKSMEEGFGIQGFDELFALVGSTTTRLSSSPVAPLFSAYAGCGRDKGNR